ncbi:hypothetical protein [Actinoplanes sp. CA-252034]|uniref:hypothetical protein n=1 Tax=Actinoplanes sp. CA-252034 TaxID=3239906 RepID=UPI003D95D40D
MSPGTPTDDPDATSRAYGERATSPVERVEQSRSPASDHPGPNQPIPRWRSSLAALSVRRSVTIGILVALVSAFGIVLFTRPGEESPWRQGLAQNPVSPPSVSLAPSTPPVTTPPATAAPRPSPTREKQEESPPQRGPVLKRARFELVAGVTEISVRIASLDQGVFRVRAADGSAVNAGTSFENGVLRVKPDSTRKAGRLTVILTDKFVWHVQLNADVRFGSLDLARGTVNRIDLDAGAERIDLSLGRLRDTVPIRMTGTVDRWHIETTQQVPVRMEVSNGAADVSVYGDDRGGIPRQETIRRGDLNDLAGLDIDAAAPLGSLDITDA